MRMLTQSTLLLTSVSPVCSLDSVEQRAAFLLTAVGHCDQDPALLRGSLQTAELRPQSHMTSLLVYSQQVCQRDRRRKKYKTMSASFPIHAIWRSRTAEWLLISLVGCKYCSKQCEKDVRNISSGRGKKLCSTALKDTHVNKV